MPSVIMDEHECPVTKLNGGLSQLHSAAAAAIAWLTNYRC